MANFKTCGTITRIVTTSPGTLRVQIEPAAPYAFKTNSKTYLLIAKDASPSITPRSKAFIVPKDTEFRASKSLHDQIKQISHTQKVTLHLSANFKIKGIEF